MQIEVITKQDLHELKQDLLKEFGNLLQGKTEQKEWLKSADVQKLLSISSGTLQTLRINKTLPYSKIGGTIYYPKAEVLKMLNNGKNNVD